MFLARNGVPWEWAMQASAAERAACIIIINEQMGRGTFDWTSRQWIRPPPPRPR